MLSVTLLHGVEAMVWAAAFLLLGALPERKMAMLYSLSAMTDPLLSHYFSVLLQICWRFPVQPPALSLCRKPMLETCPFP